MMAPETAAVTAALTSGGEPARFVGGCVRDALSGRPVKDVDIATPLPPEAVTARVEAAGLRAVPTGIAHGTVTVLSGGRHFEVTTLRRDVTTDGRRATVAFTDDWVADAARRDLTVNAMFCDADGTLYDPFGGREDLSAGRIRFVGDPRRRIDEDALRLLRFFRFHAHYGRPPPDADSFEACREKAPSLAILSGERIRDETLRLLDAERAPEVLRMMIDAGILQHYLPEGAVDPDDALSRLARLIAIEASLGECDPLRRLAALTGPCGKEAARAVADRLRLSNAASDRLAAMVEPSGLPLPGITGPDLHRAVYRRGRDRLRDEVLLARAASPTFEDPAWDRLLAEIAGWPVPRLPLRGTDLLVRGIPRGEAVGRLLAAVEDWWAAEDFGPTREALLERLDRLVAEEGGTERDP